MTVFEESRPHWDSLRYHRAQAAEEALRASEATYRTIFDAVSDAIVLHDAATGAILHVNAKFCEMFGSDEEAA
jgi:PAS domain-containing protein